MKQFTHKHLPRRKYLLSYDCTFFLEYFHLFKWSIPRIFPWTFNPPVWSLRWICNPVYILKKPQSNKYWKSEFLYLYMTDTNRQSKNRKCHLLISRKCGVFWFSYFNPYYDQNICKSNYLKAMLERSPQNPKYSLHSCLSERKINPDVLCKGVFLVGFGRLFCSSG